jgi:hypothetical protein
MLGTIATISLGGAAGTILAGSVFEIGTTASVRAEIDTRFDELAAHDRIVWSPVSLTATYVSSIKLLLDVMVISLRIFLKACLTSKTALVGLGELIVASWLNKIKDYVGMNLQARNPNGMQYGKHSGVTERQ